MSALSPAFPWKKATFLHERAFTERAASPRGGGALLQQESGAGSPPGQPWQELLQAILVDGYADEPLPPSLSAPSRAGQPGLPFSGLLQPFLRLGAARLRSGLAELGVRHPSKSQLVSPSIETPLLEALASRLNELASRVLILELNVARMMERLQGSTPQERFHHFSTVLLREP